MLPRNGKIVLKSGRAAAYAEDVTEFVLTCANGVKAYVQVKRSDNLGDVRSRIVDFFDSDFLFENFLFQVNSVPVSKSEEVNTPAWQFSGEHICIISADVDSTSMSQSKPIIILDE